MHHSLLTLNHEVGLERNLALRSHARAHKHRRVRAHTYSISLLLHLYVSLQMESWSAVAQQTRMIHSQVEPPSSSLVFISTTVFRK